MKKIFKLILLISFALATQNQLWGNLNFAHPFFSVIKVALVLSIFELFVKPIVKFLLFPINLLTLGLFRVVINTVGIYLAAFIIKDFSVKSIILPESTLLGVVIPALMFTGFWAHLVNSVSNSFLLFIFKTILKPKKEKK